MPEDGHGAAPPRPLGEKRVVLDVELRGDGVDDPLACGDRAVVQDVHDVVFCDRAELGDAVGRAALQQLVDVGVVESRVPLDRVDGEPHRREAEAARQHRLQPFAQLVVAALELRRRRVPAHQLLVVEVVVSADPVHEEEEVVERRRTANARRRRRGLRRRERGRRRRRATAAAAAPLVSPPRTASRRSVPPPASGALGADAKRSSASAAADGAGADGADHGSLDVAGRVGDAKSSSASAVAADGCGGGDAPSTASSSFRVLLSAASAASGRSRRS